MSATEFIDGVEVEHRDIVTNGVRLHCVVAGPADGELVVLLHGFPEYWRGMAGPLVALAHAGFRVVAPDQRGYGLSEKPEGIDAYRIEELSADIVGLIDALGRHKAHVVGHDWGAAVAWWVALTASDRVDRLVIINVPHPSVFAKTLRTERHQQRKSWYIGAFQLPWLPERVAFGDRMVKVLRRTSTPGAFGEDYLASLKREWRRPGAGTAMVNWYRASVRRRPERLEDKRVHVPTMIIWGRNDLALSEGMVKPSADLCDDVRVEFLPGATHWVLHDEPELTGELLVTFLRG